MKRARIDEASPIKEDNPGSGMHIGSKENTRSCDKVNQADIKYVNVLYNTKSSQNGLSEGPTMVEKEVSHIIIFSPGNHNLILFAFTTGADQDHEMGRLHLWPL